MLMLQQPQPRPKVPFLHELTLLRVLFLGKQDQLLLQSENLKLALELALELVRQLEKVHPVLDATSLSPVGVTKDPPCTQ